MQKRDFPEFLDLRVEKTPVRDELGQTNWTKKNNIDILLSSLAVNAFYVVLHLFALPFYCSVVEQSFPLHNFLELIRVANL